jgi:hypothetical protein
MLTIVHLEMLEGSLSVTLRIVRSEVFTEFGEESGKADLPVRNVG